MAPCLLRLVTILASILMCRPTSFAAAAPTSPTTCTDKSTSTYPNKAEISCIYKNLESNNLPAYFAYFDQTNIEWVVEGTHPLAGVYHNLTVFATDTLFRLEKIASTQDPLKLTLANVIGGGEDEWSAQELHVQGTLKNGLVFDDRYSWNSRWNKDKKTVQVRAYLDSELVSKAVVTNEVPFHTYHDPRNTIGK